MLGRILLLVACLNAADAGRALSQLSLSARRRGGAFAINGVTRFFDAPTAAGSTSTAAALRIVAPSLLAPTAGTGTTTTNVAAGAASSRALALGVPNPAPKLVNLNNRPQAASAAYVQIPQLLGERAAQLRPPELERRRGRHPYAAPAARR
jgi:hypothetical protein